MAVAARSAASNLWGSARLATEVRDPTVREISARISIAKLDVIIGGRKAEVRTKIVSGGIPPGMEGLWEEYQRRNYDTQRLMRDTRWKERGVDHTIIGHMWRLVAQHRHDRTRLVLASGDGKKNEFGTSFYEVLHDVLKSEDFATRLILSNMTLSRWVIRLRKDRGYPTMSLGRSWFQRNYQRAFTTLGFQEPNPRSICTIF